MFVLALIIFASGWIGLAWMIGGGADVHLHTHDVKSFWGYVIQGFVRMTFFTGAIGITILFIYAFVWSVAYLFA